MLRRGQTFGIGDALALAFQRLAIYATGLPAVQQRANAFEYGANLFGPGAQGHVAPAAAQFETGLASTGRDGLLVVLDIETILVADGIAVSEQAENQEGFEETHLVFVDTTRVEGGYIQGTYFHVLDAAIGQRDGGLLP